MSDTHNKGNSFSESSANKNRELRKFFNQKCPECGEEIKFCETDIGDMKLCPKCEESFMVMLHVPTGFKKGNNINSKIEEKSNLNPN